MAKQAKQYALRNKQGKLVMIGDFTDLDGDFTYDGILTDDDVANIADVAEQLHETCEVVEIEVKVGKSLGSTADLCGGDEDDEEEEGEEDE